MQTLERLKLECLNEVRAFIEKGEPTLIEDLISNAINEHLPESIWDLLFVMAEDDIVDKDYDISAVGISDRGLTSVSSALRGFVYHELSEYLYDLLSTQIQAQYEEKS